MRRSTRATSALVSGGEGCVDICTRSSTAPSKRIPSVHTIVDSEYDKENKAIRRSSRRNVVKKQELPSSSTPRSGSSLTQTATTSHLHNDSIIEDSEKRDGRKSLSGGTFLKDRPTVVQIQEKVKSSTDNSRGTIKSRLQQLRKQKEDESLKVNTPSNSKETVEAIEDINFSPYDVGKAKKKPMHGKKKLRKRAQAAKDDIAMNEFLDKQRTMFLEIDQFVLHED
eukprot:CFRG0233T1